MNTADTAWTITGFVLVGLGVLAVFTIAPFMLMTGDASQGRQYARREGFLVVASVVVPPLVIGGIYLAAIVLACRASGRTAHYPWIVLVLGVPLWFGLVGGLGYVKDNLMYWFPRSSDGAPGGPPWTGAPQTASDALAALKQWGTERGFDIAVKGMHVDRFPDGWTIFTELPTAPGDPQAVLDAAEPVYFVGDSGAIDAVVSGDFDSIRTEFSREEIRRGTRR